jgi:hypothetical protein
MKGQQYGFNIGFELTVFVGTVGVKTDNTAHVYILLGV